MNRLYIKQALLAVATMLSVPAFGMMDTFKAKAYKAIENPRIYHAGVAAIDGTANFVSNSIVRLAHIARRNESDTQKNQRFAQYNEKIDRRLKQIEDNLRQDEINTINGMYKEFGITNEEQQTINSIISQYKEVQKEYLSQPQEKKTDTLQAASPEILSFCKHVNIHPSAVELKTSDSSSHLVAHAEGLRASYQFENNSLVINDNDIIGYPGITLHPQFFERSYEDGVATIGHELTHLALQHHTTQNILGQEMKYFANVTSEEIINSKYWNALDVVHERQAEILHKNAEWASIMRNQRNGGYYDNHLFLGHYAQLAEIDELHKLKDKLKNYEPIPVQKIDSLKTMKFNDPRF